VDRYCDGCHHKHKCTKRCVGTFDVKHKIYEICCYEVVRVCPHCGFEFDHKQHHHCPSCGMGMHDLMHHKFGQYGGYKHEFGGYGYGREMDGEDPEEDY
jgi:hypothetical protein